MHYALVLALMLTACTTTGKRGFDFSIHYAREESIAVEKQSTAAVEQGALTPETGDHILKLNAQLREVLESAEKAHAEGNEPVAQDRLDLSKTLLDDLKRFLVVKHRTPPPTEEPKHMEPPPP